MVAAFSMTAVSQNERLRILDKDRDLGVVLCMGLDRALKRFQKCQSMLWMALSLTTSASKNPFLKLHFHCVVCIFFSDIVIY